MMPLVVFKLTAFALQEVPVGTNAFITSYVRSKALDVVQDVEKLDIMKDPLTKHHLLKFC